MHHRLAIHIQVSFKQPSKFTKYSVWLVHGKTVPDTRAPDLLQWLR